MSSKVEKGDIGWRVVSASGAIIADAVTNSEAWRIADRANLEPLSRKEETADWSFRKSASGE